MARMRKPQVLRPQPSYFPNRKDVRRIALGVEAKHLLIAWLALSFAFSVRYLFRTPNIFPTIFLITMGTAGLGFILHELAHKFGARRYGHWAEFRVWPWGLAMALMFALISGGSFIFAAPGATYIVAGYNSLSWGISKREDGMISLAGPLTNIALAIAFFYIGGLSGLYGLVGVMGYQVNLWLAAFNMIPIGGMDGQKVLRWHIPVWIAVAIPLWIIVALQMFL